MMMMMMKTTTMTVATRRAVWSNMSYICVRCWGKGKQKDIYWIGYFGAL